MPGTTDTGTPANITVVGKRTLPTTLASRVTALIEEAKQGKSKTENEWKKFREYYEGDQWPNKDQRASWRVSNVINVSFANVETACAVVMSMMPDLIATPANETGVDTADKVSAALKFLWKKLGIRRTVTLCLKDSLIYGSGIVKTTWNPKVNVIDDFVYEEIQDPNDDTATKLQKKLGKDGKPEKIKYPIGEVSVRRVSPFHFNPDPHALSIEDAAYVVEYNKKDMDYIRQRWPEKADLVQPDTGTTTMLDKSWSSNAPVVAVDRDSATVPGSRKAGDTINSRSQVTLYEVWVRNVGLLHSSDEKVDWKAEYEEYPNGRVIIMAGSTILQDMANPFEDGQWPYKKFDNVSRPDRFWGKSEIDPIMALQDELNRRSSQISENAALTANAKVAIPLGSGLDKDSVMTTKPGEKWPYRGNVPPSFVTPPQLPAYVFQSLDRTVDYVEKVTGNYGILSGSMASASASAISAMKEMAEQRPRVKLENLCDALAEMGQLMVSRMQQYYDQPREIAVFKDDTSAPPDFEKISSGELGGQYDIDINMGAALPSSLTVMFQWVMSMFEAGIVDAPAVLETIQFPKRDQIQQRMEQAKQDAEQKQMELAQAGQQPPAGGATSPQGPPKALPPGQFSMRGEQAGASPPPQSQAPPPPAPPENLPPEMAALLSQIMEGAKNGEGLPPNFEQMVQQLGAMHGG